MEMLIAVAKIWVYFLYVVCAVGSSRGGLKVGGRLGGRDVMWEGDMGAWNGCRPVEVVNFLR